MGEIKNLKSTKLWLGSMNGKEHSEDLGIDGMTIKNILWKYVVSVWYGFVWLRIETSGGLLCYTIMQFRVP